MRLVALREAHTHQETGISRLGGRKLRTHLLRCHTGTVKATLLSHPAGLEATFHQLMFDSLTTQYLIQTPDYHLFTLRVRAVSIVGRPDNYALTVVTAGCISGCVSGISPVLELDRRVLVDYNIIQRSKALSCKAFNLLTYRFGKHNWRLDVSSPANIRLAGVPTPRI